MREIKIKIYNLLFYNYTSMQIVGDDHDKLFEIYKNIDDYNINEIETKINEIYRLS